MRVLATLRGRVDDDAPLEDVQLALGEIVDLRQPRSGAVVRAGKEERKDEADDDYGLPVSGNPGSKVQLIGIRTRDDTAQDEKPAPTGEARDAAHVQDAVRDETGAGRREKVADEVDGEALSRLLAGVCRSIRSASSLGSAFG